MKQGKLLTLGRKVNSRGGLGVIRGGIFALLGSAFLLSAVQAATYRWTDDDGQQIYSQVPPGGGRPYTVIGAPPPAADAAREQARLEKLRQQQADNREDRELADKEAAEAAKRQAIIDRNCAAARANIIGLEGSPNRLTRLPDGSVRRMLPEEREAKLAETRAYVEKNCH